MKSIGVCFGILLGAGLSLACVAGYFRATTDDQCSRWCDAHIETLELRQYLGCLALCDGIWSAVLSCEGCCDGGEAEDATPGKSTAKRGEETL